MDESFIRLKYFPIRFTPEYFDLIPDSVKEKIVKEYFTMTTDCGSNYATSVFAGGLHAVNIYTTSPDITLLINLDSIYKNASEEYHIKWRRSLNELFEKYLIEYYHD